MAEPDISNFSPSSSHRLPTISASQALENASMRSKSIPTSLPTLDAAFIPDTCLTNSTGLPRGHLTEIYGPPGAGKTAFAMQLASNAVHISDHDSHVTWIDTSAPIPGPRFTDILSGHISPLGQDPPSAPPGTRSTNELLAKVSYFHVSTLAHLLTLFLHPSAKFPPSQTSLIVVDNVSSLFATSFPTSSTSKVTYPVTPDSARKSSSQWAANRKWAVAGDLASAMAKMAAIKNIAIVVVNQVATSFKGRRRAVLKPSLSGNAWEAAVNYRIVLFRDFASTGSKGVQDDEVESLRFAQMVKAGGKSRSIVGEEGIPFMIERGGLTEICLPKPPEKTPRFLVARENRAWKRKADEIAGSEDEGDELAWDDDFGLPDQELLNEALERQEEVLAEQA